MVNSCNIYRIRKGSVGGINPNPYGTFQFGPAYTTATYACRDTSYYPTTLYAPGTVLQNGTTLYIDTALTIPFNGGNYFYKYIPTSQPGSRYSVRVDGGGDVIYGPVAC